MKDLGELHHFFGMHVQRNGDGLLLSQRKYMLDILDRASMADCKPCSTPVDTTPIDTNPKIAAANGAPVADATEFCNLAGALQYLTFTKLILPTQFSKSVSTCMILACLIWLRTSALFAIFRALFVWGFATTICIT